MGTSSAFAFDITITHYLRAHHADAVLANGETYLPKEGYGSLPCSLAHSLALCLSSKRLIQPSRFPNTLLLLVLHP
jgi:hypothetical protein